MEAPYRSIGIISSRIGATGQIIAVDDAVKETNTKVLSIMLPRDTKGGGGHGNYIVIGAETVADARKAVELTLEKTKKNAGEIYVSSAGHLEMAFSPRADQALELAFGIPQGKHSDLCAAVRPPIGMVMADLAVKSADVEIAKYMTPNEGTSHTNEVIVALSGETSAVKTAVLTRTGSRSCTSWFNGRRSKESGRALYSLLIFRKNGTFCVLPYSFNVFYRHLHIHEDNKIFSEPHMTTIPIWLNILAIPWFRILE